MSVERGEGRGDLCEDTIVRVVPKGKKKVAKKLIIWSSLRPEGLWIYFKRSSFGGVCVSGVFVCMCVFFQGNSTAL